jgi:hypothetical protein
MGIGHMHPDSLVARAKGFDGNRIIYLNRFNIIDAETTQTC